MYVIISAIVIQLLLNPNRIIKVQIKPNVGKVSNSGTYYTSLINTQQLVRDEQVLVNQLVQYKQKLLDRLDFINMYGTSTPRINVTFTFLKEV